jgi:hypothetical protein
MPATVYNHSLERLQVQRDNRMMQVGCIAMLDGQILKTGGYDDEKRDNGCNFLYFIQLHPFTKH